MAENKTAVETDVQLGDEVKDTISGFIGVVTTIGYHVSGCVRIGVRPKNPDNGRGDEEFFYEDQLVKRRSAEDEFDPVTETDFVIGERVQDSINGFEGVVTVINFSLMNTPRILIESTDEDESTWVDDVRVDSVVGKDYIERFNGVQETNEVEATGSGEDFGRRPTK